MRDLGPIFPFRLIRTGSFNESKRQILLNGFVRCLKTIKNVSRLNNHFKDHTREYENGQTVGRRTDL